LTIAVSLWANYPGRREQDLSDGDSSVLRILCQVILQCFFRGRLRSPVFALRWSREAGADTPNPTGNDDLDIVHCLGIAGAMTLGQVFDRRGHQDALSHLVDLLPDTP
jgi:hypothetical protein